MGLATHHFNSRSLVHPKCDYGDCGKGEAPGQLLPLGYQGLLLSWREGLDVAKLKMVGLRHAHITLTGSVVLYCVSTDRKGLETHCVDGALRNCNVLS